MRSRLGLWIIRLAVLGVATTVSAAPVSTYHIGNSLTWDTLNGGFVAAAAARGYDDSYGYHIRGSAPLSYIWDNPSDVAWEGPLPYGHYDNALPNYHWDAVTLQSHPGFWSDGRDATLSVETQMVSNFIALARTNPANASTRFYVFCPWTGVDLSPIDRTQYARGWLQPTSGLLTEAHINCRAYFDDLARAVTANEPSIGFIRTGEVLYQLDQQMLAGQIPGFDGVASLSRDGLHLNELGQAIAAWTAYATIFDDNPVGLSYSGSVTVQPAALQTMQETIWDVVNAPEPGGLCVMLVCAGLVCLRRHRTILT